MDDYHNRVTGNWHGDKSRSHLTIGYTKVIWYSIILLCFKWYVYGLIVEQYNVTQGRTDAGGEAVTPHRILFYVMSKSKNSRQLGIFHAYSLMKLCCVFPVGREAWWAHCKRTDLSTINAVRSVIFMISFSSHSFWFWA